MRKQLRLLGTIIALILFIAAATVGCQAAQETPAVSGPSETAAEAELGAIEEQISAGAYEDAQAELEEILAEAPDNAEAHFQLALVHFNLGDYEAAREHFNRALEIDPGRAAAVHHNLGVLAYQTGDLDAALEEFDAALEADPDDPDTHYQKGAAYLMKAFPMGALQPDEQLLQQAEDEFERALHVAPQKPEALVGLANVYMLRNEPAQAIELLEDAVERNPDLREGLFALGRAYALTDQPDKAAAVLQQFLETDPPAEWAEQAEAMLDQLGQ